MKERQQVLIQKKKKREHLKRIREKRYGKTDAQIQEELLMEAKRIIGIL